MLEVFFTKIPDFRFQHRAWARVRRFTVVSIQSRFDTSRFDTSRSRFVTHVKSIRYKLKSFRYRSKLEKSSVGAIIEYPATSGLEVYELFFLDSP